MVLHMTRVRAALFIFFCSLTACTTPPKSPQGPSQIISSNSVAVDSDVLFVTQLLNPSKASDEALLIAPFTDDSVYLLNHRGETLHRWQTGYRNHHAKLGPDGLLYGLYRHPKMNLRRVAGLIAVHSPEGKQLWSYEDPLLHHTLEPLPNGHVLALKYKPLPAEQIQGIIKKSTSPAVCDEIAEITPDGKIPWSLTLTDLIRVDQKYQGIADPDVLPSLKLSSYCRTNSIRYYEKTVFSDKPAVLISIRHLSLVLLIEKDSKKILWSSEGLPLLGQHDARIYSEDVLLFNNNAASTPEMNIARPSEVLSIDLKTKKIKKIFGQKDVMLQDWRSAYMSGASRAANGNTMISIAEHSQVWELTPDGEMVFKLHLISPKFYYELGSGFFTAETYPMSFLKERKLLP